MASFRKAWCNPIKPLPRWVFWTPHKQPVAKQCYRKNTNDKNIFFVLLLLHVFLSLMFLNLVAVVYIYFIFFYCRCNLSSPQGLTWEPHTARIIHPVLFPGGRTCLSRTDGKRVVGVGNGSGTQGTKYILNWSHTFCRNLTLIYCTNHVSSQIGGLDALDISSSGFSKAEEIVFCPWISWAMRRWPWISYLLAVFCLQGCSSNDKPSKESSCFLTRGGVGLAYKKDCSSSKLVETDLPYPVRWKILQDENFGDFNVWMFQGLSFFSPRRGLHFSFCLTMNL